MDCVLERDRILPLESYGQALDKECRFPVVLCHRWDAPANLLGQFYGRVMPYTSCFKSKCVEDVGVLSLLFCAVFWAAALGVVDVSPMWDSAYVSGTVTSDAIGFPLAQGRRLDPSGRLLSSRIRLVGCLTADAWAVFIAPYMTSFNFKWLWRWSLGALLRQGRSCSPRAFTIIPHTHVCGSQASQPNRWASVTLTASSYYFSNPRWEFPRTG